MLPFFFRHYDSLVDRYFIHDNGSTDRSLEILRANPKVAVGEFRVDGASFVREAQRFNNECWKQSRGQAEWVIVCNIDEHLYHPDWDAIPERVANGDVAGCAPDGYNMYCDKFPESTGRRPAGAKV